MNALCETQHTPTPQVGAVVVAAGESRRMMGIDKIFYPLNGTPLVCHSISVLHAHSHISEIVLVTSKESVRQAETIVEAENLSGEVSVCEGGERRQDSVHQGLQRLRNCELIMVHDGARPFINKELLDRGISAAQEFGAAVAAVPVKDTIKQSDSANLVTRTIPRDRLWSVQTPQVFRANLLEDAHRRVQDTVTDDASMVEAMGHPVKLFLGSYYNIKITTPEDLTFAQAIINLNESRRSFK